MAKKYLGAKLQRNHQIWNTIRKAFYIAIVWYFSISPCSSRSLCWLTMPRRNTPSFVMMNLGSAIPSIGYHFIEMFLAPGYKSCECRHKWFACISQGILHSRRNLWIDLTMYQVALLQILQRLREHLLGTVRHQTTARLAHLSELNGSRCFEPSALISAITIDFVAKVTNSYWITKSHLVNLS